MPHGVMVVLVETVFRGDVMRNCIATGQVSSTRGECDGCPQKIRTRMAGPPLQYLPCTSPAAQCIAVRWATQHEACGGCQIKQN
jgi:hypothetical protein